MIMLDKDMFVNGKTMMTMKTRAYLLSGVEILILKETIKKSTKLPISKWPAHITAKCNSWRYFRFVVAIVMFGYIKDK